MPAFNTIVVWIGFDNTGTSTPTVNSLTKPGDETANWVRVAQHNASVATSAAAVRGEMWAIQTTVQWASGTTIVATMSASPPKLCSTCQEFSSVTTTLRGTAGAGTGTTGAPTASTSGTAIVAGDLVLGGGTFETSTDPTGDSDTTNGSWSTALIGSATGGATTAQVRTIQQYKIPNATGVQTYNPTANSDCGAVVVALQQDPVARLTGLDVAQAQAAGPVTLGVPPALYAQYDAQAMALSNNDPVSQWDDETGNGRHLTQGTAGNQPTFLTSGINGHEGIQFATDDFLATAGFGTNVQQPVTYFVVVKMNSLATDQNFIDGIDFTSGSRQNIYFYQPTSDWAMYSGGSNHIAGGTPDTDMHVLTCLFDGNNSVLRVDGTQVAAGGGGLPGTAFQNGLRVGSDPSGASDLNAVVGEIQMWTGAVTGTQRDTIEADLAAKWAPGGATDLVGLGVAQAQSATIGRFEYNLSGLGVAQAQSATNLTIASGTTLANMGVAQAQAATLTGLTQVHVLAGLGVAQGQTAVGPALTQLHVLAGLNVAQIQRTSSTTWDNTWESDWGQLALTQVHVLAGLNVAHPQSAPNISLAGAGQLVNLGVAQAQKTRQSVDTTVTLTQVHVLAGLNVSQAQSAPNIALTQVHVLAGLNVAQAQAATIGRFTYIMAGLGVAQAQAAVLTGLTQLHILAGLGVAQGQSLPQIVVNSATNLQNLNVAQAQKMVQGVNATVALTQLHVLAGLGVAHAQATADPTLLVLYQLVGLNVAQAHKTRTGVDAAVVLVQQHVLAALGVAQAQTTTNLALTQLHILAGLGVAHPQSVPNVGVTGAGSLSGLNVAQAQATADPVLERVYNLLGLNVAQAQTATAILLGLGLRSLGVSQAQTATVIALTQLHVLGGLNVLHPQAVEALLLTTGAMPFIRHGDGRVIQRYGDGRLLPPAEGRIVPRGA